jgi:hypothetical protein
MLYPVELQNQSALKKPCKDKQNINTSKNFPKNSKKKGQPAEGSHPRNYDTFAQNQ